MDGGAAVAIRALEHRFGAVAALRGIDASVPRGCVTGLVGPDGAGKTTLMRLLAGLLRPTRGEIRVEGLDPVADGDALRARLGYMPQKFGLYEDLSVQENLDLHADLRGITGADRQARFARLLAFTDLQRFTARAAGRLSGGMKQKLGLACALLGTPRVLLLDEPSVGVDPLSRRELWRMVRELAGGGMAVLWSTSYLDEAERCAQVLILHEGALAWAGAPGDLTARMQGRSVLVRGITGNRRQVLRQALRQPEVVDGVIQGSAVRLVLREPGMAPARDRLDAGAGATVVPVPPRLEDAYIDLLGGGPGGESVLAEDFAEVCLPPAVDPAGVIVARALTRRFGDFVATDAVDFTVRRGEIFGLLGPNGAGKSTTFRMMCGLLAPTAGQASVLGIDMRRSASRARRQLGYMAQKFALYGNLSVAQNLEFFSGIYGLRGRRQRERVARMVEVFDLAPYLGSVAGELPLGFKQRLALSCALMHQPPLLFLDEPTSGVDPVTRREFWTHINGLVDRGVTVMVTTHFMDEAEYCDRIGLVYHGRLIASGTPDELKARAALPDLTGPAPGPALPDAAATPVAGTPAAWADLTMEEAFVRLVQRDDRQRGEAA